MTTATETATMAVPIKEHVALLVWAEMSLPASAVPCVCRKGRVCVRCQVQAIVNRENRLQIEAMARKTTVDVDEWIEEDTNPNVLRS